MFDVKNTILFFVILITNFLIAQELEVKKLLPPEAKEYHDLNFLQEELKGKRLVMLGEQSHMYGNIFEMKARVLEYLHKELGFTTLAMESSMYEIWKMNQEGYTVSGFNQAIFGVWSNSKEFQRVAKYIKDTNLKVIGFDSQMNSGKQFVEDFFQYCKDNNINIQLNKGDLGIIIEDVINSVIFDEEDISLLSYEKELLRILTQIQTFEDTAYHYHWYQIIKGLLTSSKDAYYFRNNEPTEFQYLSDDDNLRDQQMADNLLRYMERNPSEKIVCWADNIHTIKSTANMPESNQRAFVSMGSYLHKELQEESYSLATIHANDSIYFEHMKKWQKTPIESDSFEAVLKAKDEAYLFVSSNQKGMQKNRKSRIVAFHDFSDIPLAELHDGYLFLNHATLAKKEGEDMQGYDERRSSSSTATEGKEEKVIIKGQLLDVDTKEPVAFASIILKEEAIYRIADENGYFEIPITTSRVDQAKMAISSNGFKTKTVLLQDISSKTYLEPKFEAIQEIVIKSTLSPKKVIEKAIAKKEENHPMTPFNYRRYATVLYNRDDVNQLDLEVISKEYDEGYNSSYVATRDLEQIKWNSAIIKEKPKYISSFFKGRENAIRYASVLHKRKYKKFTFEYVQSKTEEDEDLYIIAFKTDRNRWNYTNMGHPTKYSGQIYIDKESFAIVKVVQSWESSQDRKEIEKYFKHKPEYKKIEASKHKFELTSTYSDLLHNGTYFANSFFQRAFIETNTFDNQKNIHVNEVRSYIFDVEIDAVAVIESSYSTLKKKRLDKGVYDASFWEAFYERGIGSIKE